MQKFQNLITLIEEQRIHTSPGFSNSPKSKVSINHDDQLMKASLKAHDSRQFLLQHNPKSVHERLNSLIRKKSSPTKQYRKHHSLHENSLISNGQTQDEMQKIILPINEIPLPKQYKRIKTTENTDISMEMHLMKYPKLQNFYQIKRLKENSNQECPYKLSRASIDNSRFQLKYGVNFEKFITKLPDQESRIRIQKIYDRYTYQKNNSSVYTEIPDGTKYSRLVETQTNIVKDVIQNRRLSRSNQKKLEQNLKDIYRQILKN